MNNFILNGIMGLVVGDALGVPVEFIDREELAKNPIIDMREFGTHDQPKGTWSDDSSMTLCLAESLISGLNYSDIAEKFFDWLNNAYMTANGQIFDVGRTTLKSIMRFNQGTEPTKSGGASAYDNGNGSLMRILPIAFHVKDKDIEEQFEIIHNVSSITHAHPRALIACGIYIQIALELIKGIKKEKAIMNAIKICRDFYNKANYADELAYFGRIFDGSILNLSEREIKSSGYVIDTLEAALWCLSTTDSYKSCVLKAVNLGEDTDTIGAVSGGLAGILYGYYNIPKEWIQLIVKRDMIEKMCDDLYITEVSAYNRRQSGEKQEGIVQN